jgi:hypothetical protein
VNADGRHRIGLALERGDHAEETAGGDQLHDDRVLARRELDRLDETRIEEIDGLGRVLVGEDGVSLAVAPKAESPRQPLARALSTSGILHENNPSSKK